MSYLGYLLGLSIGAIIFAFVFVIAIYVLFAVSHMKALQALGYDKPWLAWIPYANWFACADCVSIGEDSVTLFGSFSVPAFVFKFWWVVPLALLAIPLNDRIEQIINLALNIVFLGCTYAKMYARLDGRTERDEQVLGCVSGFLPIVAVIKFLTIR